jgi:hypothetical protein
MSEEEKLMNPLEDNSLEEEEDLSCLGKIKAKGKALADTLIPIGENLNKLAKAVPGVFEKVSNFIFLYNMYKFAVKTPDQFGPKLVAIWLFICSFSTYVLTYSCVLNNLLQNRTYEV